MSRAYYEKNKVRILEQQKLKYEANKEEIRRKSRQRYATDAEFRQRARDSANQYRTKNRETVLEKKRDWYNNNKERHYASTKMYRQKNPEVRKEEYRRKRERDLEKFGCKPKRVASNSPFVKEPYEDRKAYMRQYVANRRKVDPGFALTMRCRRRVRRALSRDVKSAKTLDLIGCSALELKQYIEAKFLPGMSWDCLDRIHIDHIRPLASFDLNDPEQQRIAFHYTNLQPLWAEDNLRKHAKWED
jgi:hypothetical protein